MEQLNRNQRRKNDLEIIKLMNKLSPREKMAMDLIVHERFMLKSEKYMSDLLTIFLDCSISALRQLNFTTNQIEQYAELYQDYYKDHMTKTKLIMEVSEMEKGKLENDLRENVLICLSNDLTRQQIVDKISMDMPKVSKNRIHNMIDRCNQELKKEEKQLSEEDNLKIDEAMKEIFPEEFKEEVVKVNNLKIKSMTMIIEGENGEYTASKDGVILVRKNAQIDFKNIEELDKWTNEVKEVFKMVQ